MPELDVLWSDGTLVAAAASAQSGWINVAGQEELVISRNQAGGTYAFEIDWSRDGATVDFTEAVTTTEDDQVNQPVALPWARFRVRNTDGVNGFTAHRTTVAAWG